jgi:putative copper resistance protein D
MQYLSFAIDALYSTASLLILGTLVIAFLSTDKTTAHFQQKLLKNTFLMVVFLFISGLFLPSLQAISLTDDVTAALDTQSLKLVLFSTRFGSVWATQELLALLLLINLYSKGLLIEKLGLRPFLIVTITISCTLLFSGVFKGHAAGLEPAWPGLLGHGIHLLAAGSWLGALPALYFLMRNSNTHNANSVTPQHTAQLLSRFSILASTMVGFILLSGILIGYLQINRWGELFATTYGQYLLIKVALFIVMLLIAFVIRQRYLPKFITNKSSSLISQSVSKWVVFETTIGLVLLGFANAIKNTTPAAHDEINTWPFSIRFSLDATWEASSSVQTQVFLGFILMALAAVLTLYFLRFKDDKKTALITGLCLSLTGVFVSLQPLAVTAYPDTYRNATVPYDAISIGNGAALFNQQCASCHGAEGKGDGVLADTLDVMLMDLSHMHSVGDTAGDMYWSLSQDIFKDTSHSATTRLDEDETWELINYLNAQTASYTGLSLYTYIDPLKPFLGAPDFYYATQKTSGNLKDFREDKAILLVLFSWPEDKKRLDALKKNYKKITATNTDVIAVEITSPNNKSKGTRPDYPFTVVTEQTGPIINTYSLFRRSKMSNRDFSISSTLTHIEFIIDRFGYLRARWIPEANTRHWTDFPLLIKELEKLAKEPEILPPPNEHVH